MPRGKDTKSLFLVYNLLPTELQKVFYLPLFYCKDYLVDMNFFKCIPKNKQANEFRKSLAPLCTATKDAVLLCPQRKRGWQKLEALHQNYDGGDASFTQ